MLGFCRSPQRRDQGDSEKMTPGPPFGAPPSRVVPYNVPFTSINGAAGPKPLATSVNPYSTCSAPFVVTLKTVPQGTPGQPPPQKLVPYNFPLTYIRGPLTQ